MARIKPPRSIKVGNNPALKRLDANNDGKITRADFKDMSPDQQTGAMVAAAALAEPGIQSAPDTFELDGKKLVFSGLEGMSKDEAKKLAQDAGANVVSGLSGKVDVLVVGDEDKTGKDEKAIQMNASGLASIRLMKESDFVHAAKRATSTDVLDIGGAGAPFEKVYVTDTDDFVQIPAAMKKKARAAMEDAAREYWDAFGEDTGYETAQDLIDQIGEMAIDTVGDDTIMFAAGYGYGAMFAELDRKTGDVTDAYEYS
jgi:hypothetical protein